MAPRRLLLWLAAAGTLLLGAGCQTHDSRSGRANAPSRAALTTGLLLVPAQSLSPEQLAAERTRIIAYLRERALLEPDDILVDDLAAADRIIRVVIGENGGYVITDFGGDRRLERGDVYAAPPPGPFVYESPFLPWGLAAASWYYTTSPYAPGYFPGYYDYLPRPRYAPPPRPVVSPPPPSKPERPHRPHDHQAPGRRDRPPPTPSPPPPPEGPRRPRPPHAERPDVRPPPPGDRPRPSSPPPASAHPRPAPAPNRPAPPPTPPPAPKPPPEKTERTPSANDSLRTHAN